jgi:Arc/MetJ family transcription regulator
LSDVVERFEREAGGRRRGGLEPVRAELDGLLAETVATVRARSAAFWEEYESDRDPARLAAWFVPRCWREIDYVFMLGEVIRRYGLTFERRHVTALSRQLLDEAEHYDAVARIVERLGGRAPVAPPPSAIEWTTFLWDSLDRHRLGAIAAWNMSETAATGTLEAIVEAGRRYDLPDVVRAYEQIIRDEKFHVGLGRLLLDRYSESDADRDEVMRAMRGMAAITLESHVAIDPG